MMEDVKAPVKKRILPALVAGLLLLALGVLCWLFLVPRKNECSYQRVRDKELARLLNAITFMGEKDFDRLSVRVIAVSGESGSAHLPETDEVSTTVYVAVSEYDEYPEQRVFRLAPLYAPELERFAVEAGNPVVRLTWGSKGNRRRLRIVVTLDALDLQEEPTK